MSNKEIPYLSDMISIMRDEINEIGLDGSLNELTEDRVLPTYFTLRRRLISQKPRIRVTQQHVNWILEKSSIDTGKLILPSS